LPLPAARSSATCSLSVGKVGMLVMFLPVVDSGKGSS
jgi:hypothetical protein